MAVLHGPTALAVNLPDGEKTATPQKQWRRDPAPLPAPWPLTGPPPYSAAGGPRGRLDTPQLRSRLDSARPHWLGSVEPPPVASASAAGPRLRRACAASFPAFSTHLFHKAAMAGADGQVGFAPRWGVRRMAPGVRLALRSLSAPGGRAEAEVPGGRPGEGQTGSVLSP